MKTELYHDHSRGTYSEVVRRIMEDAIKIGDTMLHYTYDATGTPLNSYSELLDALCDLSNCLWGEVYVATYGFPNNEFGPTVAITTIS